MVFGMGIQLDIGSCIVEMAASLYWIRHRLESWSEHCLGWGITDCASGSADIWCTQNCCIVDFLYDSKYIFRNGYLSFLFGFVINGLQEKFELSRQLHFRIIHTFRNGTTCLRLLGHYWFIAQRLLFS